MTDLAARIAAQLHTAIDHQLAAGITAPADERGLAAGGPDAPVIVLSVEDVARIAAQAASTPSGVPVS